MREMIQRYGTCAMLAWQDGKVVGQLRFYPIEMAQLVYRADPEKQSLMGEAGAMAFEAESGTLWVQCVMTTRPYETATGAVEAGARKGVGQSLVREMIAWATAQGWERIVKQAHADLDCLYGQFGGGGKRFWEKAGFRVAGTFHKRAFDLTDRARDVVEPQMAERGMTEDDIWTWYRMVCEL